MEGVSVPTLRRRETTLGVLLKFVIKTKTKVDVRGILSLACYNAWLSSRKDQPKVPHHAFRKLITGHVRGDVGLKPFPPDVEAELLKLLRYPHVWDCFVGTKIKIGKRGIQTLGYWEKLRMCKSKLKVPKLYLFNGPTLNHVTRPGNESLYLYTRNRLLEQFYKNLRFQKMLTNQIHVTDVLRC